MAAELTKMVQGTPMQKKLKIILGDFIKGMNSSKLCGLKTLSNEWVVDLKEIGHFDVFISNTPYQISSPLVFKLLAMPRPPRVSVYVFSHAIVEGEANDDRLMVQREFAQRLIARPGDAMYSECSACSV
jgi:18S rRNA (adenine1779-N6/adenine1780-N6)-dimethyltransferase